MSTSVRHTHALCKVIKGLSLKLQAGARGPGPQDNGEGSGAGGKGKDRSAAERACWRAGCAEQKSHAGCGVGQKWAEGFRPLLRLSAVAASTEETKNNQAGAVHGHGVITCNCSLSPALGPWELA